MSLALACRVCRDDCCPGCDPEDIEPPPSCADLVDDLDIDLNAEVVWEAEREFYQPCAQEREWMIRDRREHERFDERELEAERRELDR